MSRYAPRVAALEHGTGPVRFSILAPDPSYRTAFRSFFHSFGPPPSRPSATLRYEVQDGVVTRGDVSLGSFPQPVRAANRIVLDLGEQVPQLAEGHICLHAGLVSSRGRGLLLPAGLKGGKSTLTLGMVRRGWTYYTDDVAILRLSDLRLFAFPRPIDLRAGVIDLFPRLGPGLLPIPIGGGRDAGRVSVRVDRRRTGQDSAKIRWIVFPHVQLGKPTSIRPLPRGESLLRLSQLAFDWKRFGQEGFEAFLSLVRGAECYTLEIGRLSAGLRAVARISQ